MISNLIYAIVSAAVLLRGSETWREPSGSRPFFARRVCKCSAADELRQDTVCHEIQKYVRDNHLPKHGAAEGAVQERAGEHCG